MPAETTVKDYFAPDARRELIDRAALIVALVEGRENATRTDYAHPKLSAIVEILKSCSGPAELPAGATSPASNAPASRQR
jgi:hypothetical protein